MNNRQILIKVLKSSLIPIYFALILFVFYGAYRNDPFDGDSYQWLEHARNGLEKPIVLFKDLDTFYRPTATWLWAIDYLIGRDSFSIYRVTNLFLLWIGAVLLWYTCRKFQFSPLLAFLICFIWLIAPFNTEAAMSCSSRFDTTLNALWLGMVLIWPEPHRTFNHQRLLILLGLFILAMLSKETWVVTPALLFVLAFYYQRKPFKTSLLIPSLASIPVGLYIMIYFAFFPLGQKHYFHYSLYPLKKIPMTIAAFFEIAPLQALAFDLDYRHLAASLLFISLIAYLFIRDRTRLMMGLSLFFLPQIPTLLSPYQPQRWLTIPYEGFLILIASAISALLNELKKKPVIFKTSVGFISVFIALLVASHMVLTREDARVFHRVARVHARLLREARQILPKIPPHSPIVAVRLENAEPLLMIRDDSGGIEKLFYRRTDHPYSLVETRSLFDFVGIPAHRRARPLPIEARKVTTFALLIHRNGRFDLRYVHGQSLESVVRQFRAQSIPIPTFWME